MTKGEALTKLRASRTSYRRLFECAADAMLLIDAKSCRVELANEAAMLLYGYTRVELIGKDVRLLSAERQATEELLLKLRTGHGKAVVHRIHRRSDGSTFPVEIHTSSCKSGRRCLIIASMRDLSERDESRRALLESEGRFREMAENISQVFWMTDPAKSRMLFVSPAYESIWGRSCASLYASPRSWLDAIVPADRARVAAAATAQADGGYDVVYRIQRPDGGLRWIRDRGYPVRDRTGGVVRVVGAAEDITAQRHAEEERRETGEALLQAQEAGHIGTWSVDLRTGALTWSGEAVRIFGLQKQPADTEGFFALVHPEDREAARRIASEAGRPGGYEHEYRIIRPDGAVRLLCGKARLVTGADGTPTKLLGIVQDVTQAREESRRLDETEKQLRLAQKMEAVGRLAGGVAHDFNNILTAILGLSEMGAASLPAGLPLRADLEEIRACALRAANLTQQLLAFSRRQIIEPRVIDLDDTMLGLSRMLRRVIGEDVDLRVEPNAAGAKLLADPGQLEQLVMNLAVNSRDAMPDGGTLAISTSREDVAGDDALRMGVLPGRYAIISVSDDGCGMDEETRGHIFEPFFTTKEQGKGTGLGLATCYGIVKQNRGAIECRSAPAEGTTFRILLPETLAAAAPSERTSDGPLPRGTERVLLVEDEEPVRRLGRRVLEELGYEVLVASDGADALRQVREDSSARIRLVITDMVMPQVSGRRLAEALSTERPGLRVLFTTGYTDDTITVPSGLDLLRKPFSGSQLATRVRARLDAAS
jgi:two-component system cell cycle sensor histidine kinase/response regulator CckA